jgi:hypothetical protein
MPKHKRYFVVEFRLPFEVDDVTSVPIAVNRAKVMCENMFGFIPENWYARIFEYETDEENVGPFKEYFYNPNSATFREIDKNIGYHKDMIEKGIDPTTGVPDGS